MRPIDALARHIASAMKTPLPAPVVAKARQHLLDSISAMVSGAVLPPGELAIAYVTRLGGAKEACVPGTGLVTSAVNAAMAGGMCAHADETDDSHQPGFFHPGCAIVPAALAMAEREARTGADLLRAVVLGYEIGARVSLTLGAMAFHQRGFSSHSVAGVFGAAAAAGALAGLDEQQCRWLLSYAAQQASGVSCWMRDPSHVEKAFVLGGMTARNGVSAATMVQAGMSGLDDVFSGTPSFFSAFAPGRPLEPLTEGLGERHEILRANIKKWSVGSPVQAALDSMHALVTEHRLVPGDIERIHVQVRDDEAGIVDGRDAPNINMQHLLALMVVDGNLDFASSHDFARMADPQVVAVRQLVKFEGSAKLREAGGRQALLEVRTKGKGVLRHHTRAVRGAADNPMMDSEVDAKCIALLEPVLGSSRARRLADAVWDIEAFPGALALRRLMRPTREPAATDAKPTRSSRRSA